MRTLFRTGPMVSAMGLAAMLAFGGGTTAAQAAGYDGVYAGVSARNDGDAHCPTPQTPGPLTIANGTATTGTGFFIGTADASGHVVLHTKESTRFEGQIDATGTLSVGGGTTRCAYTIVWKRR